MANLTTDQVRHIATLARLKLTDAEIERYSGELTKIFAYIDLLREVDTKQVEATAQVTGLTNSFRKDVITPAIATPDALLTTSPLPIVDHQIETPSAHG